MQQQNIGSMNMQQQQQQQQEQQRQEQQPGGAGMDDRFNSGVSASGNSYAQQSNNAYAQQVRASERERRGRKKNTKNTIVLPRVWPPLPLASSPPDFLAAGPRDFFKRAGTVFLRVFYFLFFLFSVFLFPSKFERRRGTTENQT